MDQEESIRKVLNHSIQLFNLECCASTGVLCRAQSFSDFVGLVLLTVCLSLTDITVRS